MDYKKVLEDQIKLLEILNTKSMERGETDNACKIAIIIMDIVKTIIVYSNK